MFAMQFYLSVNPLWHLGGVLWELSVYLRIWTLNMNRTVSTWRYGHRTWTEPCLLEDMDTEHEQNRVYLKIWTPNINRTVSTWGYGHRTWTEPCLLEDMDTEHEQNRVLLEDMDTEHEQNRVYLRIWTLNMNRTVSTWGYGHWTWTEPCLLEDMYTEHEQNRIYLRIWTLNMNRTVSTWGYGHWTWTEPCFTFNLSYVWSFIILPWFYIQIVTIRCAHSALESQKYKFKLI
jgi:hypothetical protein